MLFDSENSNVLILGANGNVGQVVCALAHEVPNRDFRLVGADMQSVSHAPMDHYTPIDLALGGTLVQLIRDQKINTVIAMVPPQFIPAVARTAISMGVNYIDPTEVVETRGIITASLKDMAPQNRPICVPHSGLAPGFIQILGAQMASRFNRVDHMLLSVGALSQEPMGQLHHGSTWSADGLVTECLKPCEVLKNGEITTSDPLASLARIILHGKPCEIMSTSGGLGTLPNSWEGQVQTLRYGSIRFNGHRTALTEWLEPFCKDKNKQFFDVEEVIAAVRAQQDILMPRAEKDQVIVYVKAAGEPKHGNKIQEFSTVFRPIKIGDQTCSAIQWTTAAGIVGVLELLQQGKLKADAQGIVRQESINRVAFFKTFAGSLYPDHSRALNDLICSKAMETNR